jgi:hypothetical protein
LTEGRRGWKLFRKSERRGRGTVYNLSVEEDEFYMADGAVVRNCRRHSGFGGAAPTPLSAAVARSLAGAAG